MQKNPEKKYAPANINFYLSGTFFETMYSALKSNVSEWREGEMHQRVVKKKTNDPEAKYAIAINLPFLSFSFQPNCL